MFGSTHGSQREVRPRRCGECASYSPHKTRFIWSRRWIAPRAKQSAGALDVTPWLAWFLDCLPHAVKCADGLRVGVLDKAQFWRRCAGTPMNARQTLVLNHVLDRAPGEAAGKLTNAKWAAIAKWSADTALRDINDLLARGVLRELEGAEHAV